jgi:hypothetical protein
MPAPLVGEQLPKLARMGLRLIWFNIAWTLLGGVLGFYSWKTGEDRGLYWHLYLSLLGGIPLLLLELLLSPAYTFSFRTAVGAGTRRYRRYFLLNVGLVAGFWLLLPLLAAVVRWVARLF